MDAISTTGAVGTTIEDTKKILVLDVKPEEFLGENDIIFKSKGLNNNAVMLNCVPPKTIVTASCLIIRVKKPAVLPEYVVLWLNSKAAKNHFAKATGQATGLTIANVGKGIVEDLPIKIPPIKIQKVLVEIERLYKQEQELLVKIANKKEVLNRMIIEKELQKY